MNGGGIRQKGIQVLTTGATTIALLVGLAGSAQATPNARGNAGTFFPAHARCERDRIAADAPAINPAPQQYSPQGSAFGGPGVQWVRFRASLAKWFPGVGWNTVRYGTWKLTQVSNQEFGARQYTTLQGQPVGGTEYFPIDTSLNTRRYLAVYVEVYWYPDQYRDSGSDWSFVPHHENRGSYLDQSTYPYCRYPEPNFVVV